MEDTREVPNTKGKSDLWKHFNLLEQDTDDRIDADVAVYKQCSSVVKCAGGTSNMSKHTERQHPLSSLFVCLLPHFLTDLTAHLEVGSTGSFNRLSLSTSVDILVFHTGMDMKNQCAYRFVICTGTQPG